MTSRGRPELLLLKTRPQSTNTSRALWVSSFITVSTQLSRLRSLPLCHIFAFLCGVLRMWSSLGTFTWLASHTAYCTHSRTHAHYSQRTPSLRQLVIIQYSNFRTALRVRPYLAEAIASWVWHIDRGLFLPSPLCIIYFHVLQYTLYILTMFDHLPLGVLYSIWCPRSVCAIATFTCLYQDLSVRTSFAHRLYDKSTCSQYWCPKNTCD